MSWIEDIKELYLKNSSLLRTKGLGNLLAFTTLECDASFCLVEDMVLHDIQKSEKGSIKLRLAYIIEATHILRNHVELATKSTESFAIRGMPVSSTNDIWAGSMNISVDHESGNVEKPPRSRLLENVPFVVNEQ